MTVFEDPAADAGIVQKPPRPGMVELGPGYLDPALIPDGLVGQWAADALRRWGTDALAYGANAGPWELRSRLAARVASTGSAGCGPANVIITGGTSAILDTLAIRFAREGRTVLTEELTYDFGRLIFTGRGVKTVAVPAVAGELDVSLLSREVKRVLRDGGPPPAIYLIPTFHNPTGRVLPAGQRRDVLAVARETGSLVIEDQAYADLGYDSAPLPEPLWHGSEDPERVIALYTLAKSVAPGLRIGWLVGSERLVAELADDPVRVSGGGPNHFTAMLVMAACVSGQLDARVSALREELRLRRNALAAALAGRLPEGFTFSVPAGGFFAWVGLPPGVSDVALLEGAEKQGMSFAAGRRFGPAASGVRLCFAACEPDRLALGAERFLAACRAA